MMRPRSDGATGIDRGEAGNGEQDGVEDESGLEGEAKRVHLLTEAPFLVRLWKRTTERMASNQQQTRIYKMHR